jgi:trans-2,3-dihydro-3-hydroxyanthranilate isomerase
MTDELVAEDPATGSAAGPLCAYLHERTGAARVDIEQGVAMGRPSRLLCEAGERVRVAGDVVLLADGELDL